MGGRVYVTGCLNYSTIQQFNYSTLFYRFLTGLLAWNFDQITITAQFDEFALENSIGTVEPL